nr:MAG TPA: hypothetical protein [Caudoviricetes sp.]
MSPSFARCLIALWASLMEIGRPPLDGSWLPLLDYYF